MAGRRALSLLSGGVQRAWTRGAAVMLERRGGGVRRAVGPRRGATRLARARPAAQRLAWLAVKAASRRLGGRRSDGIAQSTTAALGPLKVLARLSGCLAWSPPPSSRPQVSPSFALAYRLYTPSRVQNFSCTGACLHDGSSDLLDVCLVAITGYSNEF